jgi:hypothetical protein
MISSMHVDPRSPARAAVPGGAHERSPTAKSPDNNHKKARPLGVSKATNSPQSATPADAHSPKLRCAKVLLHGADNDENDGAALAVPFGGDRTKVQQPFGKLRKNAGAGLRFSGAKTALLDEQR